MSSFSKSLILCLLLAGPIAAQNSIAKLEGQIVCCAECWAEADRTKVEFGTAEDLLKAKSCVEGGDPTLLAVREGDNFKLYQLATGKFRLPGKNWLEFIGKRVAVQGTVQPRKEHSIIRVDSLQVIAPSLAEQNAVKTTGKEVNLTLKDLSGVVIAEVFVMVNVKVLVWELNSHTTVAVENWPESTPAIVMVSARTVAVAPVMTNSAAIEKINLPNRDIKILLVPTKEYPCVSKQGALSPVAREFARIAGNATLTLKGVRG